MLLEFDWPLRVGAGAIAVALLTLLVVRARTKDRREYRRFRRYRSTARRQGMLRKWVLESILVFGGAAAALLALVWPVVSPLLAATQELPWVVVARDALGSGFGVGAVIGALLGLIALTVVGVRSARTEGGVIMVGDIVALLPRNRPELGWGAALSINAGVVEEALFRLALPALLVIVTGEPVSAFAIAALAFGALHAYQGPAGMLGATLMGVILTAVYVLSGSILIAMLAHALLDLRTLVVIPMAVYRVHRVPGSVRMPPPLPLAPRTPAEVDAPNGDQASEGAGSAS